MTPNIVAQYAQAVQSGNTQLAQFYRKNLVRAGVPAVARTVGGGDQGRRQRPASLFEDQDYLQSQFARLRAASRQGRKASCESQEASGERPMPT